MSRRLRTAAIAVLLSTVMGMAGCSLLPGASARQGPSPAGEAGSSHTPTPPSAGRTPAPSSPAPPSSTTPPPDSTTTPGGQHAPLATAQEMLSHQLGTGEDEFVVAVPAGYEGVIFDNVGHLRFYASSDGMTWRLVKSMTYVYDARDAVGQHLKVTGALLSGMQHATFLLTGTFSGDGSGQMMAYTVGAKGWGPVARHWDATSDQPIGTKLFVDGALPAQDSREQVAFRALRFDQGYLVWEDCDTQVPPAQCGQSGTTFTAWWHWDAGQQLFVSAQ